jgi:hypothetical protein
LASVLAYLRPDRIVRPHYIGDGLVGCPMQGVDVDVETCLRCVRLREVVAETARPYIVCDGVAPEPPVSVLEVVPPTGA